LRDDCPKHDQQENAKKKKKKKPGEMKNDVIFVHFQGWMQSEE
jgi:hypothetical protein